jgi:hypothetical protein
MPSTCGPNEAPGRNQVVWSFTCGPNEAPGRNKVNEAWQSFTCEPNETPGRNQMIFWSNEALPSCVVFYLWA